MGEPPSKPLGKFQKMAEQVHGYVINPTPANRNKLVDLITRLKSDEVKKLETNYPHRCGKDFVDRINQRLLRDHVKKHWATAPAQAKQVLEMLETKNPMAPGAGAKTGGLTAAQRKQAIAIGKGMKNNWPKAWVPVDVLADWLFKDQVWRKLCGAGIGGGVGYTKHGLAGPSTNWLFRTPKEDEISKWGDSGAAAYVREIAQRIDKQLTNFSEDIGWFISGRGTVMAGEGVIAGLKGKIRSFQKSWEDLGKATATLHDIKAKLLLPKSTFMKYLWSEAERSKLRLWRESKSK